MASGLDLNVWATSERISTAGQNVEQYSVRIGFGVRLDEAHDLTGRALEGFICHRRGPTGRWGENPRLGVWDIYHFIQLLHHGAKSFLPVDEFSRLFHERFQAV